MALAWYRWGGRDKGEFQGSECILLFGLPFLFAWSTAKHLDVSSVQLPLWGCSWDSFESCSPEAARMDRADVKPSRRGEMGNRKPLALDLLCRNILFAAWSRRLSSL